MINIEVNIIRIRFKVYTKVNINRDVVKLINL